MDILKLRNKAVNCETKEGYRLFFDLLKFLNYGASSGLQIDDFNSFTTVGVILDNDGKLRYTIPYSSKHLNKSHYPFLQEDRDLLFGGEEVEIINVRQVYINYLEYYLNQLKYG